jgi:hypothetical protein
MSVYMQVCVLLGAPLRTPILPTTVPLTSTSTWARSLGFQVVTARE